MCKSVPQFPNNTQPRIPEPFLPGNTLFPDVPHVPQERRLIMNEKELQTILDRSGYKIPPYRMGCMMKSASKIIDILFGSCPVAYTAQEAKIILDIVDRIRETAVNGREA